MKRFYTKTNIVYTILYSETLSTSDFTGIFWFDIFCHQNQKYVKP